MSTLESLQKILIKDYDLTPEQLTPDATLATLGIDSLGLLELMFKIEDCFRLKISEDTPTDLTTISDVVRYIDELLARRPIAVDPASDAPLAASPCTE